MANQRSEEAVGTVVKVVAGLAVGVVGGFISGIMFARKSGKETRQDIVNSTKKITATLTDKVNGKSDF